MALTRRAWGAVALVGAGILASGLVPGQAWAQTTTVAIGAVLEPNINIPLIVARDRKLFEAENLRVELRLFPTGTEIVQAIAGGSLDLGATGGVPATILAARGRSVKAVARLADISRDLALLAAKDAPLNKPEDIKGKTVGIAAGTVSEYLVVAFARHWGIPLDSFQRVNLGGADQVNAIARGGIQVASLWAPFTARLEESGYKVLQTATRSAWPGQERPLKLVADPGVLFARTEFLGRNAPAVEGILRALRASTVWIDAHPDEAAAIAAKALNTSTAAMRNVIGQKNIRLAFDQALVDDLSAEATFLREQKIVPADFDTRSWMDPGPMRTVFPDLVSYKP